MGTMSVFERINDPRDIRTLTKDELLQLCREIREYTVDTVQRTGGHISSSLGTVELTVALHRVFESPRDKLVWDTGHQAYVHKMLTGRRDRFDTLRQLGGISGFLVRTESEHDQFGAGHAGTSISAAHGMALARDIKGEDFNVVAVIGDGALTAGMAFEGLNNVGHDKRRMIVVLNDNGMSIAPNVGAVSRMLETLRTATPMLSWYSVPSATRYRVQVATAREFGTPVFDNVTPASGTGLTIERMTVTALPPGRSTRAGPCPFLLVS